MSGESETTETKLYCRLQDCKSLERAEEREEGEGE